MSRNLITNVKKFQEEVHDWHAANADAITEARGIKFAKPYSIAFESEEKDVGGLFGNFAETRTAYAAHLNDHAFGQLSERLLIPAKWAANPGKCPDELREMVFNWKTEHAEEDKNFLVRMREIGDEQIARAVMSDQYTPFDHVELVDALVAALDEGGVEADVWRPDIDDVMRGYFLIKGIDFGAGENGNGNSPRGDGGDLGGTKPAIYFSNSEIGTGKLRINGGLYRSYCSNGVVLGWNVQSSAAITHRWRTKAQLSILANHAIAQSMNMSEQSAKKFFDARAQLLNPIKLDKLVGNWARKYGLTVDSKQGWLTLCQQQLEHEERISKFDLVNHASDIAGSIENSDERESMEVMAGDLIWNDLNNYLATR